jgi:flagellar hook-associated protein 1 FlgK
MSLSSIFGAGLTGLQAAQAGMRVVSQNIANVNTPGYARATIDLQPDASIGGVIVSGVRRAADQFLSALSLTASAQQGDAAARSDLLDRAQAAFGDPTSDTSLFASLDAVFTRFTELAGDPSNTLRRSNAVSATQTLLSQLSSVGQQLESLRLEADERLGDAVAQASNLMSQIAALNSQIQTTRANAGDATAAENAQAQLIDQLSSLVDIRVTPRDLGGVDIRTAAGALLVSDQAAQLSYAPISTTFGLAGSVQLIDRNGAAHPLEGLIQGGTIAGLMSARDQDLPALSDALGALAGATADALNAAHNDGAAVPAATTLTGRQSGLLSSDLVGFTGKTTLAVTDSSGDLVHTIAIDFSARTLSVDGGAAASYGGAGTTIGQLVTAINTALGASATMSFSNGVMTVAGQGGNGVLFQQDAAAPSSRGGRGFAQFFGLNDLVTRQTPSFFETGFAGADAHGLNGGGALSFRVLDSSGRDILDRSVSVTGATWSDMITALNAAGTGLGAYGAFALDSQGRLTATMANGYRLEITGDTTSRGATGLSMSTLFGLDRASAAGRALDLGVNAAIAANPSLLATARPDLSQAIGARVLETGDGGGAAALAAAGDAALNFKAVGAMAAQSTTLLTYATRLGGEAGRRAQDASNAKDGAQAVYTAAAQRRSAAEGVQLDDELVKMTQYQQSYAAASRLIQAARDMYDMLLSIANR